MSEHFLRIACPSCRKRLRIKSELFGKTIRCPNNSCGTLIEVSEMPDNVAPSDEVAAQSDLQGIRESTGRKTTRDSDAAPNDVRGRHSPPERHEVSERWSRKLQKAGRITRKIVLVLSMVFSVCFFIESAPNVVHAFSTKYLTAGCVLFAVWLFLFLLGPHRLLNSWWEDLAPRWKMGIAVGLSIVFCFCVSLIPEQNDSRAPLDRFAVEFMSRKLNESGSLRSPPIVAGRVLLIDRHDRGVLWRRFMSKIPSALKPNVPEEVGTVFVLDWDKVQVGTYSPGDGKAFRHKCVVKIYDAQKSILIGMKTIWGSPPPEQSGKDWDGEGDKVSDDDILKYLDECFRAGQ